MAVTMHDFSIASYLVQYLNFAVLLQTIAQKFLALRYLFAGARVIEEKYTEGNASGFVVQTPGKQHVMVTSPKHIRELGQAPSDQLSLHAVAKEFMQPRHTLGGFEWHDQRGVDVIAFVRGLKELLPSQLPKLLPQVDMAVVEQFRLESAKAREIDGYRSVPLFGTVKGLIARTGCIAFFGPTLSQDPKLVEIASRLPDEVFAGAECFRLLPSPVASLITQMLSLDRKWSRAMFEYLYPLVIERLNFEANADSAERRMGPKDVVQRLIKDAPASWTVGRIVEEIMGVWIGSMHTLAISTTYAILDLYCHPEHIETLREEVETSALDDFKKTAEGLPLMDSFLKESLRTSSFESTAVHRVALTDFNFSDGLRVSKGDWICVPLRPMMQDPKNFEQPHVFDPFRHYRANLEKVEKAARPSKLTDSTEDWMVWGTGRIRCPGRFYASVLMKLTLSHLLLNYDCKLQETKGSRSFIWRSAVIPKASLALDMKRRCG